MRQTLPIELFLTIARFPRSRFAVALEFLERAYMLALIPVALFTELFPLVLAWRNQSHESTETEKQTGTLDFLPLMLTSVYCAIGIVWAFLRLSVIYLRNP